jgi:hypothetical protein
MQTWWTKQCSPPTEILDEVDVAPDGFFEHRFLLFPAGEFGVRFKSMVTDLQPASASDRR